MATSTTIPPSVTNHFDAALQTFTKCSKMFIDAYDEQRINFDDDVLTAGLTVVSTLTASAIIFNEKKRITFFLHLIEHGPELCRGLITEAERRSPPTLTGQDLRHAFLDDKEQQGAGI